MTPLIFTWVVIFSVTVASTPLDNTERGGGDEQWSSSFSSSSFSSFSSFSFSSSINSGGHVEAYFCNGEHFTCGDGRCIPVQWECDWDWDCADHSDEHAHCAYQGEMICDDNTQVPSRWICDGFPDCVNGEDEEEIFCYNRTSCTGSLCDNRLCAEQNELCDGVYNCGDHMDEAPLLCDADDDCFLCDNGALCIDIDWRCDGIADCHDLSDESTNVCGPVFERCDPGSFLCKHNHFCVYQDWRCDGENDCGDLSDEFNCDKRIFWANRQGWDRWGKWSKCSTECGEGVRNRTRTCRVNVPFKTCHGADSETQQCTEFSGCAKNFGAYCGHKHTDYQHDKRVVGGELAGHGDWPWQAQLIYKHNGGRRSATCGGTLIHQRIVISAAHCFMGHMNDPTKWLIHMGKHGINMDNLAEHEISRRVIKIEVHPEFSVHTMQNDLAILVLESPVVYGPTEHIRWLCIDRGIPINKDLQCYVSGWGVTEMGGLQAKHLQEARLPIIDNNKCSRPHIYGSIIKKSMLCAGHLGGGIDACQGDSGGPLSCLNPDDGLWYLVGITSWGHGCALPKRPGIYTRVAYFQEWIIEVVSRYL